MSVSGINNLLNSYYSGTNSLNGMSSTADLFDYKSAQKDVASLLDSYKQQSSSTSVSSLKKSTSDFLTQYTSGMNGMNKAASVFTNGGVNDLLYDKEGNVTDETVKKTVDATKSMLKEYNNTIALLDKNADRGQGVTKQLARMVSDPAAKEKLDALGVSVGKDGTLSLDEEKLTSALKDENPLQVKLMADFLGGSTGLAAGIQKDARAGLNASSSSLVGNDIATIQKTQDESNPFREMYTSMRGGGAYGLNNNAAVGMMLNMFA